MREPTTRKPFNEHGQHLALRWQKEKDGRGSLSFGKGAMVRLAAIPLPKVLKFSLELLPAAAMSLIVFEVQRK